MLDFVHDRKSEWLPRSHPFAPSIPRASASLSFAAPTPKSKLILGPLRLTHSRYTNALLRDCAKGRLRRKARDAGHPCPAGAGPWIVRKKARSGTHPRKCPITLLTRRPPAQRVGGNSVRRRREQPSQTNRRFGLMLGKPHPSQTGSLNRIGTMLRPFGVWLVSCFA